MNDRKPMDRNNPLRNEVLSLARREATAGRDVKKYREDLGDDAVDAIIAEVVPPKKAAKPKKTAAVETSTKE